MSQEIERKSEAEPAEIPAVKVTQASECQSSEAANEGHFNAATASSPGITLSTPEATLTPDASSLGDQRNPELSGSVDYNKPFDGLFIDEKVSYSLALTFDRDKIPSTKPDGLLHLNNPKSYKELESIAENQVKRYKAVDLTKTQLIFRHGECTIFSDNESQQTYGLKSLEDWMEVRTILVNFIVSKTHSNLHLQISRDYYTFQQKSAGYESFTNTKRFEIDDLMCESFLNTRYVPRTDILRLTSPETISEIIHEEPPPDMNLSEVEDFIKSVQHKARKLLVQCVLAQLGMGCLKTLMDKGLSDEDFPLEASHCCHKKCLPSFRHLLNDQGGFRAAEFNIAGLHQKIHRQVVVPIELDVKDSRSKEEVASNSENESSKIGYKISPGKKNAWCGVGAYSNVYRVKINHDHHRLQSTGDVFAMKEFKDRPQRGDSDFQKELKILDELRKYPHEHIVTHLGTWEQDGKYYMLFPYAECNLRQYMRRIPFNQNKDTNLWLLEQFRGVASALRHIHNLSPGNSSASTSNLQPPASELRKSGWHHDLKPENVLFFRSFDRQIGTFGIADFGSGKVHSHRSRSINTASPNGTLTYEPPEVKSEGKTSRPYDVWSLGCVLLEMLIWVFFDFQSVKNFARERIARRYPGSRTDFLEDDAFWQMDEQGKFFCRKIVMDWIQRLKAKAKGQDGRPFYEVLDLILRMLNPERKARIRALDLWDTLDRICYQKKVDMENAGVVSPETDTLPRLSLGLPGLETQEIEFTQSGDASGPPFQRPFDPANKSSLSPAFATFPGTDQEPRRDSSASESRLSPIKGRHRRDSSKVSAWSTDAQGSNNIRSGTITPEPTIENTPKAE